MNKELRLTFGKPWRCAECEKELTSEDDVYITGEYGYHDECRTSSPQQKESNSI